MNQRAKMTGAGTSTGASRQFSSRTAAASDFKAKYSNQYTSRYTTEPRTRPSHIPRSYNGRDVIYRDGGYGYYDTMGRWMLYDAMSDAVMMSMLMNQHHYVVATPAVTHVAPAAHTTVVHHESGFNIWKVLGTIFWIAVAVVALMFIIGAFANNRPRG